MFLFEPTTRHVVITFDTHPVIIKYWQQLKLIFWKFYKFLSEAWNEILESIFTYCKTHFWYNKGIVLETSNEAGRDYYSV